MSRVHVWRSGGGGGSFPPRVSRSPRAWLGLRRPRRPVSKPLVQPRGRRVGFEWPEVRARRAPGGEDDGVGGGCNDGLSRRGR